MSENRCVCCGAVIPEGRQCCPICVDKYMEQERRAVFKGVAVTKDGEMIDHSGTFEEMTKWADRMKKETGSNNINIWRL